MDLYTEEQFRIQVRRAIADEAFYRQWLEKARVGDHVNNYLTLNLPRQVRTNIYEQLPGILNNNHQFQSILQNHLQDVASETHRQMDVIVNNENYHEVNKQYFQNVTKRVDAHCDQITRGWDRELDAKRTEFKEYSQRVASAENRSRRSAIGLMVAGATLAAFGWWSY